MSEEERRTLASLKVVIDKNCALALYQEEAKSLLDYITNLQEENKKLQFVIKDTKENADEIISELKEENEILKELNVCVGCNNNPDYKARNDKAIDYIHNNYPVCAGKDLLDILEGKE